MVLAVFWQRLLGAKDFTGRERINFSGELSFLIFAEWQCLEILALKEKGMKGKEERLVWRKFSSFWGVTQLQSLPY